ncbi:MAG: hypothetical protein V1872_13060 [bacterium]
MEEGGIEYSSVIKLLKRAKNDLIEMDTLLRYDLYFRAEIISFVERDIREKG